METVSGSGSSPSPSPFLSRVALKSKTRLMLNAISFLYKVRKLPATRAATFRRSVNEAREIVTRSIEEQKALHLILIWPTEPRLISSENKLTFLLISFAACDRFSRAHQELHGDRPSLTSTRRLVFFQCSNSSHALSPPSIHFLRPTLVNLACYQYTSNRYTAIAITQGTVRTSSLL